MKINILMVDDIKENLYALEVLLEDVEIEEKKFEGFNLFKSLSGDEALRIVLKEKIDLILLDVRMPGMDGFEVASFLKTNKRTSHIPIIFLTAEFKSDEFIEKGYKVGALDYFTKPIERFQFLNKIQLYIKLFLFQKIQEEEFKDTLDEYMNLMDNYLLFTNTDLEGKITSVSQAFCNVSGYSKRELIGTTHRRLRSPDVGDEFYREMWESISQDAIWKGRIKNITKSGEEFWVENVISPTYDENKKKIGYSSIKQDITARKKLEKVAITDALTGLYNRRHFNQIAHKIINSAKRYNKKFFCFALIDIDNFKKYNDGYGHQEGDNALIEVAKVFLESTNRPDDYCFRMGGEEFCILFLAEDKQKSFDYMDRVRQNIENLKIDHKGNDASKFLTISIGLSCNEGEDIESPEVLYNTTDILLYKAKDTGRNQVVSNIE